MFFSTVFIQISLHGNNAMNSYVSIFRWFIPVGAITSITDDIRYTSQTQQIYYGIQGQVNDDMFRPFYSNNSIIRSSKVT